MDDMLMPEPLEIPAAGDAMDDHELTSLLAAHENSAVGYYNSEIASEQARALDYYYGRPIGGERDGRSSVVERTVAITVDNALAALLRPFVSSDDVVSFEPRGQEDIETAEQATEYVNYVFQVDNPGFLILHNWFKDALLQKIGIVKYWWEDQSRDSVQEMVVDALGLDEARSSPDYAGEQDNGDGTYIVSMQTRQEDGRVKIENVPPEEFLVSPFARSLKDAAYAAHRPGNVVRSDLIGMGFDPKVVEALPAFAPGMNDESRSQARYRDEEWSSQGRPLMAVNDPSLDQIGILDEFVRVDYDGDGFAELRRVIRVDDTILYNEPVDEAMFAILCPIPMPHKIYGLSLADQVMDVQRIQTVIWRQMLDNAYLSNNPRPVIPDTAVNDSTYEDLMSEELGAAIRVKQPGQLDTFAVPFIADQLFPMLQFAESQGESRTGIRRGGQGLDRNALSTSTQMTATQAAQIEAKENERVEMIARIFAETGVTSLFAGILKLLSKYQPKERMIRLRNKYVEVDPRGWPEMDVRVSVGLGMGNRFDQIAQANAVLETMEGLGGTPYASLVDASKVYAAVKRKFQAAGIKNVDDFIVDPAEMPEQEQQPSPEVMRAQAEMQLERDKADAQATLAQQQQAFEFRLAEQRMAAEMELASRKADRDYEQRMTQAGDISANRPGGDLDK